MEPPAVNRYAPPVAAVEDVASGGIQPVRFWPPRGRIGRLRFLVYGIGVWLLSTAFAFAIGLAAGLGGARPEFVSFASLGVYVFLVAVIVIQRSHDMNLSGWAGLLTIIPFVGLVWLFKRGTPGPNRYGAPPPPNSGGLVVFGWIAGALMVIGMIGIVAAVAIPAYSGYSARAAGATR